MTVAPLRPLYVPQPYQDAADSGRLILRDGTTATIRLSMPDDREAMRDFFARLSKESRHRRFFSFTVPSDKLVDSFCDSSDPRARLTLVATRGAGGAAEIVAAGSYVARDDASAEVALAVDDALQGLGIGTLLLERLALIAARHGFVRFWAVTGAENRRMMEVFRDSGFQIQERAEDGLTEMDLSIEPTAASVVRSEMRDRVATTASLRPFFCPRSVVVVGASRSPLSIGHRVVEALRANNFHGPIYPVNPHAAAICSLRAYPSVRALPDNVELAVVVVPRDAALAVVDECAERGVRALVVISAGFAETGAEGRALQQTLVEKVRGYGMRMVGPNCLGLMNTDPSVRLNASFAPLFPPPGGVAMSSQSGALGIAILALARERRLGVSTFISVGNKADVSGNDLLQFWEEDERTRVILLYLESFGNPRRFARIARRVGHTKPIVALKAGRSRSGSRAASSHTAALAASDVAVDALFRQAGVVRAETLDEMFDLAAALDSQPLPRGRRVGIVTNAGGPGILCADACEAGGLVVPQLSDSTQSRLKSFLPPAASAANPVDMIASATPDQFRRAVETVLAATEVDALIVIFIPVGVAAIDEMTRAVGEAVASARSAGERRKPVLACMMAAQSAMHPLASGGATIPVYAFPESAGRALGKIAAYAEWRARPPGVIPDFNDIDPHKAREISAGALKQRGAGWLSAEETRAVLTALGLPLPPGGTARTLEEAVRLARAIGFPVAVKLSSRSIVHKTEIGGVRLGLADEGSVRLAFEEIRARLLRDGKLDAMDGVLVQPMIPSGVEVMVGVATDPLFGPLIAFGLGGIHVEILRDVCFRITPLTERDAAEMVREIRGSRLLEGYRGHPAADIAAIEEVLLRVSRLVEEVPEIGELDLNPLFALAPGKGCMIADARIRVQG
jgi:acetate---CoA ligase (ADP-forming)